MKKLLDGYTLDELRGVDDPNENDIHQFVPGSEAFDQTYFRKD